MKPNLESSSISSAKPNIILFVLLLYFLFAIGPILGILYIPHVNTFAMYADVILVRFVTWGIPILVYLAYIIFSKKSVSDALYLRRLSLKNLLYITVITLAFKAIFTLLTTGSQWLFWRESMTIWIPPLPIWFSIFDMAIVISFFEEFMFRGALWHSYDENRSTGFWKIALATGLFFGLVHTSVFQMSHTAFSGIFLFAPAVYFTRSIWAPFLVHAILNAIPYDPSFFVNTQYEFEAAMPVYLIIMTISAIILIPFAVLCAKKFYVENRHNVIAKADLPKESKSFTSTYWLLIAIMIASIFLFRL